MRTFLATLMILSLACGDDDQPPVVTPPPAPDTAAILARYQVDWPDGARNEAIEEGLAALARQECTRCHEIDEAPPAGRADHCTSCHQWIEGMEPGSRHYTMLSDRYGEDTLLRYKRNIEHYRRVPVLTGIANRLDPAWIDAFLRNPFDLRPALDETMVRTNMPSADRRAIVRYFAAIAGVADPGADPEPHVREAPGPETVNRGRELFLSRGCTGCHTYGNLPTGKTQEQLEAAGWPARLAPNLRFAGSRMRRDIMVAWIEDPQRLKPDTEMPDMQLTHEEAELVADFLLGGDPMLEPTPEAPELSVPAVLDRPVGWEEVKAEVLGRICVHCHMNDHERDLGPGNEGGFGWPGNGLAMRTYEMLIRGSYPHGGGERYSVLEPREEGGLPPIVEVMLDRRLEEVRDRVMAFHDHHRPDYGRARPGMPMGLPHIPDEQIALVVTWIAQGCPGPEEVTGMPGITDGFLVPDGPIGVNRGCGVREPSSERPEWSTQPAPEWARPETPSQPSMTEENTRDVSMSPSPRELSMAGTSPTNAPAPTAPTAE